MQNGWSNKEAEYSKANKGWTSKEPEYQKKLNIQLSWISKKKSWVLGASYSKRLNIQKKNSIPNQAKYSRHLDILKGRLHTKKDEEKKAQHCKTIDAHCINFKKQQNILKIWISLKASSKNKTSKGRRLSRRWVSKRLNI